MASAALRLHPAILAATLVGAGQTKETALPFLLILGTVLLLWSTLADRRPARSHWIGLAAGTVGSLALTGGFNWFRFGQLTNLVYADPIAHVPGFELKFKYAGSIWMAPNAGVIPFWPAIGVLLIAGLIVLWQSRTAAAPDRRRVFGGVFALAVVLAGLTAGYASWYAPFGWIAWGPRLMLLMLPAIVLAAFALLAPELDRLIAARGRLAALALGAAFLITVLGALPQIGILHRSGVMGALFAPDATCPVQQPIGDDPGYYYTCIFHWAWWKHWMLPDAAAGLTDTKLSALMGALWISVLGVLAAAARTDRGGSASAQTSD